MAAFSQSLARGEPTMQTDPQAGTDKDGLTAPMPAGFRLAEQMNEYPVEAKVYVPIGESKSDPSTSIFANKIYQPLQVSLEDFDAEKQAATKSYCPDRSVVNLQSGSEAGLPYTEWLMACPLNPQQKPETVITKTIKGNFSYLSVSYVFHELPNHARIAEAQAYLKTVTVVTPDNTTAK